MGGLGAPACGVENASTDQLFSEFSTFGGSIPSVTSDDVTITSMDEAMPWWWLLSEITFSVTAGGTYQKYNPPPVTTENWTFTREFLFPGVRSPNSMTGRPVANSTYKILDCPTRGEIANRESYIQVFPDEDVGENYTHLFPFYGHDNAEAKNSPAYLLAEFFSYMEPLIPSSFAAGLTNYGLLIISTRNKPYTDAVAQGDSGGLRTQLAASKQVVVDGYNGPVVFYASLFIINSNSLFFINSNPSGFTVSDFDVEFVSKRKYAALPFG